jgi:hypothetical protein
MFLMSTDTRNDPIGVSRWQPRGLPKLLLAIGWGAAVVVATAGWAYFICWIVWRFVRPLFE